MADNKIPVHTELEKYSQIEKKLRSLENKPVHIKVKLDGLDSLDKQLSGQLTSIPGKIIQPKKAAGRGKCLFFVIAECPLTSASLY